MYGAGAPYIYLAPNVGSILHDMSAPKHMARERRSLSFMNFSFSCENVRGINANICDILDFVE